MSRWPRWRLRQAIVPKVESAARAHCERTTIGPPQEGGWRHSELEVEGLAVFAAFSFLSFVGLGDPFEPPVFDDEGFESVA